MADVAEDHGSGGLAFPVEMAAVQNKVGEVGTAVVQIVPPGPSDERERASSLIP